LVVACIVEFESGGRRGNFLLPVAFIRLVACDLCWSINHFFEGFYCAVAAEAMLPTKGHGYGDSDFNAMTFGPPILWRLRKLFASFARELRCGAIVQRASVLGSACTSPQTKSDAESNIEAILHRHSILSTKVSSLQN
jgi:hypothetical protein